MRMAETVLDHLVEHQQPSGECPCVAELSFGQLHQIERNQAGQTDSVGQMPSTEQSPWSQSALAA